MRRFTFGLATSTNICRGSNPSLYLTLKEHRMRTISSAHYTLGICAAAAMLASCEGGSTSPSYQLPGTSQTTRAQSVSSAAAVPDAPCAGQQLFNYTGQSQKFIVPKCASTVYVDALGAAGAYCANGGEVSATVPVTPGETLVVTVGGQGSVASGGGVNGGGRGAKNKTAHDGASGGGARQRRVRVASSSKRLP
jgi:hypothetical protein